MGPEDAAVAARWVDPDIVIPMHYNTFPLIEQDPEAFRKQVEEETPGRKVFVLKPGEILEL